MKNYFVIYTDRFIPKRFSAYTIGFVILIRPISMLDLALLEHEKVHVAQFWRSLGLFGLAYKFSKKHRLAFELEAYKKQLEFSHNKEIAKENFAVFLSNNYDLDISEEDALKLF